MPLRARAPFLHQSKPLSVLLCISGVFGSSLSAMAETQTAEQTSELMGISTATLTREWRLARAKLYAMMGD